MDRRRRGRRKGRVGGKNQVEHLDIRCSREDAASTSQPDPSLPLELDHHFHSTSLVQSCERLPTLQPIRSFSSLTGLNNVVLPSAIAKNANQSNIIRNSTMIEILVHLLCRDREPDVSRRESLFKALCKVIKQWNASLYLPLHAFNELQEFRAGLLRKFEFLFEEVQSQIAEDSPNFVLPRIQLPSTGSPITQLALTNPYQHQQVDDRYSREFIQMSVLGKGGFGVVVKAQSKLDGCSYAIKIIIMDKQDGNNNQKILREVQALAQLNHPNIVRYHSTWLQLFAIPDNLWPQNRASRLKGRRPLQKRLNNIKSNNFFPTSHVKIQELSSSPEPEEETSGGIVFMDSRNKSSSSSNKKSSSSSNKKSSSSSIKTNVSDTNQKTDHSSHVKTKADTYVNEKGFFQKSILHQKTGESEHSLWKKQTESRFFNSEVSESLVTIENGFSKFEKDVSCVSNFKEDIQESVCKEKRFYASTSSSSSYSNRWYKNSLMLYRKRQPNTEMALFIQMGLCDSTLAEWIFKRNEETYVERRECMDIFKQILLAVNYIHGKKIIHRDLKPPNIFFTVSGNNIQLGDFGLARPLPNTVYNGEEGSMTTANNCLTPLINPTSNTDGVGTPIYAAPEVQFGGIYGSESDMHNLGIILLELFYPFQTGSERIHVINDLRLKRYLEPEFLCQWPDIADLIMELTNPEAGKRPSAADVLKSKVFDDTTSVYPAKDIDGMQANDEAQASSNPAGIEDLELHQHHFIAKESRQEDLVILNVNDIKLSTSLKQGYIVQENNVHSVKSVRNLEEEINVNSVKSVKNLEENDVNSVKSVKNHEEENKVKDEEIEKLRVLNVNSVKSVKNLEEENKVKDEEIEKLREENLALQKLVFQLQEQINQNSAVE